MVCYREGEKGVTRKQRSKSTDHLNQSQVYSFINMCCFRFYSLNCDNDENGALSLSPHHLRIICISFCICFCICFCFCIFFVLVFVFVLTLSLSPLCLRERRVGNICPDISLSQTHSMLHILLQYLYFFWNSYLYFFWNLYLYFFWNL